MGMIVSVDRSDWSVLSESGIASSVAFFRRPVELPRDGLYTLVLSTSQYTIVPVAALRTTRERAGRSESGGTWPEKCRSDDRLRLAEATEEASARFAIR